MTQWQPQHDPRQQRPAMPPQWGQPQYPQQPPPVQVNVTQNAYGPRAAVTQGKLGGIEELFHWTMIICTCGLWLPVYLSRKRSKRSVTVFR